MLTLSPVFECGRRPSVSVNGNVGCDHGPHEFCYEAYRDSRERLDVSTHWISQQWCGRVNEHQWKSAE